MNITVEHIAQLLDGTVEGNPALKIHAPSKIEEGFEGSIAFLSNPKYEHHLYNTKASAVLISKDLVLLNDAPCTLIRVDNVYESLSLLLEHFKDEINPQDQVISELAFVDQTAQVGKNSGIGKFTTVGKFTTIGDNCTIGDQVFIDKQVRIGNNVLIYPGVKIYHKCVIGNDCIIHANTVIGSDGFGFAPKEDGTFSKLPQIGNVVIEDNVEIGACTVIDRATMGSTIISKGVKLDNLIQIAHNVSVGENTVVAAQTGIAGSTTVGASCMIGGQVGLAGHIKIANKTLIQAKSGISANITEEGRKLYGYPALEYQNYLKSYAYFKNLDQIVDKIRSLEKEVDKLRQNKD